MIKSGAMYLQAGITGVVGFILAIVSSGVLVQTAGSPQVVNWIASFSVIIGTVLTCMLWLFCGTVLNHLECIRLENSKKGSSQDDSDKEEITHHDASITFGRR